MKMKRVAIALVACLAANHCVIKKDGTASATTAVNLSKKFAQAFNNPSGLGSSNTVGTSTTSNCGGTGSGYLYSLANYEMCFAYNASTLYGYHKYKAMPIKDGSQSYQVDGTLSYTGTLTTSYSADFTKFSSSFDMTMNGTLTVTGADAFSFTYKNYKMKTTSELNAGSYSYSYSCSGSITVEGVDYAVKSDCSIDA